MEISKKKVIAVVFSVVCIFLAVFISLKVAHGGTGQEELEGMVPVKCSTPDCGISYEMDSNEFNKLTLNNKDPKNLLALPALPCEKCGQKSVYKALKCKKCNEIYFKGAAGTNYYGDKCPKCGYSYTEELRK